VEVEADEAGEDARVRLVRVHEDLLDDVVGVGARVVVVVLAQLRRRAVEAHGGHHHCQQHAGGGSGTER